MNDFFDKTIELAKKSLVFGDVPVGALIVCNGKIIASGYNTREKMQNILGHAEINVILQASKKIGNWNLSGCDMYVSLKPCSMCMEVIKQSRISNVYYLLDKPRSKQEFYNVSCKQHISYQQEKNYSELLSKFFKDLREKSK